MNGQQPIQPVLGSLFSDRYTLDRVLGQGGLGIVYLATDTKTGKKVAVKVPSPGEHKQYAVARFATEAHNHRLVEHPNIVKVLNVGNDATGHPYMVLEYVDGITLSKLIKEQAPLPVRDLIEILLQICDALQAVHAARLVHRDLKAANIMVVDNADGSRKVTLLDFGIVKALDDDSDTLTAPSSFVGTPHYISPEEIQDAAVDGRADLYAMGILLYRMATRRFPYKGKPVQVLHATLHHRPASFQRVAPKLRLPLELQRIAYHCLEKSPSERYATAEDLANDLQLLLAAETGDILGTLEPQRFAPSKTPVPAPINVDDERTEAAPSFHAPAPTPWRAIALVLAAALALLIMAAMGIMVSLSTQGY